MRIIAGMARSRTIEAPKGRDTRPTLDRVRENLFNILQQRTPDADCLDLFAGSGALSMEALSRGARSAVLCDMDRQAHLIEKKNAQNLGFAKQCTFFLCDWREAVRRIGPGRFDLIFLDPPYRMQDLSDVTEACAGLLREDGRIVLEFQWGAEIRVSPRIERLDTRKYGIVGIALYGLCADSA